MANPFDPVDLTAQLIRCPSVTPNEGGALCLLAELLTQAGFACTRVDRGETANLFARWGAKGATRSFGFNGHTDVVPVGDAAAWTHPPFSGHLADGVLWGRGATDMKSGVAAFVAAACDFVRDTPPDGAIILAITGDEEGPATDGTVALLDWMQAQGEAMSVCLVGEPSNPSYLGEMMKIGRRGSTTLFVEARGVQGHVAYPDTVRNPCHALVAMLNELTATPLDEGSDHFQPSGLQIMSIDVGNPASNVVPAVARAVVNIRYNDLHSGDEIEAMVVQRAREIEASTGVSFTLHAENSGESFLTEPGPFVDLVRDAVEATSANRPKLSTSGGTSDARFVKDHCPVVEYGLVGRHMHQVDERVPVDEINALKATYSEILQRYFS